MTNTLHNKRQINGDYGYRLYECENCGIAYPIKSLLTRHERCHTGRHRTGPRLSGGGRRYVRRQSYKCTDCGKGYAHQSSLSMHKKSAHLGQRIPCPECALTFTQRGHLSTHRKRVHRDQRQWHSCNECGLAFMQSCQLAAHRMTAHPEGTQAAIRRSQDWSIPVSSGATSSHTLATLPLESGLRESATATNERASARVFAPKERPLRKATSGVADASHADLPGVVVVSRKCTQDRLRSSDPQ